MDERYDPLEILGPYLLHHILHFLPTRQLLKTALVSKGWHRAATHSSIWQPLCQASWEGKLYTPAAARDDINWKQRWLMTEAERRRTVLTIEELCTFTWRFRFKRTAGWFFTQIDPYWLNNKDPESMVKRFFHPDSRVTSPPEDKLWGHENEPAVWTFVQRGEELNVRINEYPSLTVTRTREWGWKMENAWVIFEAELKEDGPYCHGVKEGQVQHIA